MATITTKPIPTPAPGTYPPAEGLELPTRPNGVAAAAILAAAIGSFVLGLMIVTTEAIPAWKNMVNFVNPVGPLSGKTDFMLGAYIVALVALTAAWRNKSVDFARVWTISLGLLALGLLGSFPLFYEIFTAH
jgi:tetrahydromethanopterin S-methyltransferase subunit B